MYHPEFEIGPKSPGVWQEVRRLENELTRLREAVLAGNKDYAEVEAENTRLREENRLLRQDFDCAGCMQGEVDTLLAALRELTPVLRKAWGFLRTGNPLLSEVAKAVEYGTAAIFEVEEGS